MRTFSNTYASSAQADVIAPYYVVAVSFDDADTDITYLTSHAACLVPAGVVAIDRIDEIVKSISGQTQRIEPEKARHTIGNISINILDVAGALATKIKTKLDGGEGLRQKRIAVYKGFDDLTSFNDYSLLMTYLVDDISVKNKEYTIKCSDIQRTTKTDIFIPHSGTLTNSIDAVVLQIPITVFDAANKFLTIAHDSDYTSDPSLTAISYIKIDDEIISHSGWDAGNNNLNVIQRGALGTVAKAHSNPQSVSSAEQNKAVDEYIYIEMNAVKLIYALLTGVVINEGFSLPSHWHLSISTSYVSLTDFLGIGLDIWNPANDQGRYVKFEGLEEVEAKKFIETELALWLGVFMPVHSDGAYGLRRLQNILPYSTYKVHLTEVDVINYGALSYKQNEIINNLTIKWNYIKSIDRFTKTNQLIDSNSISKHRLGALKTFEFKGVFIGKHTDNDLNSYFDLLRNRYSAPPLKLTITAMPQWDALEVGDTIRLTCAHIHDDHIDASLDRVFEIQQIKTDWKTGKVTLNLFGGIEKATTAKLSSTEVLQNAFYTSLGANIATPSADNTLTVDGSGNVTSSGALTGGNTTTDKIYYYIGNLTIPAGVTVTIDKNVQLRISGFLAVNGKIDGKGRGYAGAVANSTNRLGSLGVKGLAGVGYTFESFDYLYRPGSGSEASPIVLLYRQPFVGQWDQSFSSLDSYFLNNEDGADIKGGFPNDLQGTSGASGNRVYRQDIAALYATGGAGGAAGAGLVVICKGMNIGVSGEIDLSGSDGGSPTLHQSPVAGQIYAGAGQGGFAGGLVVLLDGDAAKPLETNIKCLAGFTPIPVATNNVIGGILRGGTTAFGNAFDPNALWDFKEGNVAVRYIPPALNPFFENPAATELQKVAGYERKPVGWDDILDEGNKPADNANYIDNTSQLTDGAGLGTTAIGNVPANMQIGGGVTNISMVKNSSSGVEGSNDGEITLTAGDWLLSDGTQRSLASIKAVNTAFEGTITPIDEVFYIIWGSAQSSTRFGVVNDGILFGSSDSDGIFAATYDRSTNQWSARDNNNSSYSFTPLVTDYVIAICYKPSTSAKIEGLTQLMPRANDPNATENTGALADLNQVGTSEIVDNAVSAAYSTYSALGLPIALYDAWLNVSTLVVAGTNKPAFVFASVSTYGKVFAGVAPDDRVRLIRARIYNETDGVVLYETDEFNSLAAGEFAFTQFPTYAQFSLVSETAFSGTKTLRLQLFTRRPVGWGVPSSGSGAFKQTSLLYLENRK